jgi:hypothetical protein
LIREDQDLHVFIAASQRRWGFPDRPSSFGTFQELLERLLEELKLTLVWETRPPAGGA